MGAAAQQQPHFCQQFAARVRPVREVRGHGAVRMLRVPLDADLGVGVLLDAWRGGL